MPTGFRVHVNPVDGEIELVKATVPVKLFTGATVTVEVPAIPGLTVTLVGEAETVKSGTATL
jgi:hypothetical protein